MSFVDKLRATAKAATAKKAEAAAAQSREAAAVRKAEAAMRMAESQQRAKQVRQARRTELAALKSVSAVLLAAVEAAVTGKYEIGVSGSLSENESDLLRRLGFEIYEIEESDEEDNDLSYSECLGLFANRVATLNHWRREPGTRIASRTSDVQQFVQERLGQLTSQEIQDEFQGLGPLSQLKRLFSEGYFDIAWNKLTNAEASALTQIFGNLTTALAAERNETPIATLSWEEPRESGGPAISVEVPPVFYADCLWRIAESPGLRELDNQLAAAAKLGRRHLVFSCAVDRGQLTGFVTGSSQHETVLMMTAEELRSLFVVRQMSFEEKRKSSDSLACFRVGW